MKGGWSPRHFSWKVCTWTYSLIDSLILSSSIEEAAQNMLGTYRSNLIVYFKVMAEGTPFSQREVPSKTIVSLLSSLPPSMQIKVVTISEYLIHLPSPSDFLRFLCPTQIADPFTVTLLFHTKNLLWLMLLIFLEILKVHKLQTSNIWPQHAPDHLLRSAKNQIGCSWSQFKAWTLSGTSKLRAGGNMCIYCSSFQVTPSKAQAMAKLVLW